MSKLLLILAIGVLTSSVEGSEVIPPRMVARLLIEAVQKDGGDVQAWQFAFDPKLHAALTPLSREEQLQALKGIRREEIRFDKDEYAVDEGTRFVVRLVTPRSLDFEIERVENKGELGPPWGYRIIAIRKTAAPDQAHGETGGKRNAKQDKTLSMADFAGKYPLDLERSRGLGDHPNILKGVRLVVRADKNIEWGGGKQNNLKLVQDLDANGIAIYTLGEAWANRRVTLKLHADGYLELDGHFFKVKAASASPQSVE